MPRHRPITATDLGTHANPAAGWAILKGEPDPGQREPWEVAAEAEQSALSGHETPDPILVGSTPTWGETIAHYVPSRECPGCGSGAIPAGRICLVCHRTARCPTRWPMQYWPRARAKKAKRLKGGMGRAVG